MSNLGKELLRLNCKRDKCISIFEEKSTVVGAHQSFSFFQRNKRVSQKYMSFV